MRNPFHRNRRERNAAPEQAPEGSGHQADAPRAGEPAGASAREPGVAFAREPVGVPTREHGDASTREPVGAPTREARGRGLRWRSRNAGAAAVGALGGGVLMLARLVMLVASLIALLIALAIVLFDVGANPSNAIVEGIHEAANFFAGSFTGLIVFHGRPKLELSVNWGIALAVYLVVGALLAATIRSVGAVGVRFEQRHRPAL